MSAGTDLWTTRRLLGWMAPAFERADLDSPRLFAELLLAHVLGCERLRLYMDQDRPATPDELTTLRGLVKRAMAHEPVQYLVGETVFFGLHLKVDRRVLIPRPETETIVEAALEHAREQSKLNTPKGDGLLIADIGTGSGAIAIALATHLPNARVVATDLHDGVLDLAGENAAAQNVGERIDLARGDLFEALDAHTIAQRRSSLHLIVSNPPYIPDDEWDGGLVDRNVKDHEPEHALRGGADGLDLVRPLIAGAPERLAPGGLLLIEIAESRADETLAIAEATAGLTNVRMRRDFAKRPRVLSAERAG